MKKRKIIAGIFIVFMLVITNYSIVMAERNIQNNDLVNKCMGSTICESMLEMEFIYSITKNLSNIIFTKYNESAV